MWHRRRDCNFPTRTSRPKARSVRPIAGGPGRPETPGNSLLLNKPTNRIPHAGGERIKPGSQDEAVLKAWIEKLTQLSGVELTRALKYREEEAAGAGHAAPRTDLRRLTHSQYNHTVRDLLGDQTSPANQFPPEDFINGFRNQSQAQNLSPLLIEAYSAAAERLARNAFRGGDTRGLIPCKPSPACRARFVREFGLKAFRRPLEPVEQKRYEALMTRGEGFPQGAQLVVEAMLQSSSFLFRLDETSDPKWKPYVTASRLSYAIWDSMPDAELFAAAARGDLATPQGVEKAARRMLDHPRAREALDEFVSQWLRFDRILTASKDRRKYPAVHPRDRGRDDGGGARVRRRPGLERPQFHGAVHRPLRLSGQPTWRRSTECRRRRRSSSACLSRRDRSAPECWARGCSSRSQPSRKIRLPRRAGCSCANSFFASTCPIRRPA